MVVSGKIPPDPVRVGPPDPPGPAAGGPALGEVVVPGPWNAAARHQGSWLFTAPALDSSVPQVRHAVRELLHRQAVPVHAGTADGLLLIVSELVTNAVTHAAVLSPRITVEIAVDAGWIKVGVGDGHPFHPKALESDHTSIGGRGLLLVEAIAAEAGGACDVEHSPTGGKVVWAALPLDL